MIYYANWYKQLYDMMPDERPPDHIIEDDEALDRWYRDFTRRIARELAAAKRGNKRGNDMGQWMSTDGLFNDGATPP